MATGFLCEIKRQDIGLTAYAVHVPGKFSDHGYPIQPKQVLFGSSLFGLSHDNFRSQVGFARNCSRQNSSKVRSAVFQPRFFQLWIHWVIPTHVLTVGAKDDFTLLFQRFQRNDGRHHLHAVVGREVIAFKEDFFLPAIA